MRVKDLLELESLPGLCVLAGEGGLSREISSVSIMDAPDICDWMHGGEFLITSGYIIQTCPVEFDKLISELSKAQVAALGIKVDRFVQTIPESVLLIANQLNFPILYIPTSFAWVEIINPVLTEIVNTRARELMYSETIHNSFITLALGKKSIQDVIDQLSDIIKKDVMYKDQVFCQTYLSHKADPQEFIAKMASKNRVATAEKNFGYLYILDNNNQFENKYERIAIEHASTVLILMIQEKMSNKKIEYQYRSELIHDILSKNYRSLDEIRSRAALYGWVFEGGIRAIIYDIDDFSFDSDYRERNKEAKLLNKILDPVIQTIKKHLSTRFQCYYTHYSTSIICLLEHTLIDEKAFKSDMAQINKRIDAEIKAKTGYTMTIGIGEYKPRIEQAANSYDEAKLALDVGHLRGKKNCIIFYSDLGIYKFLYEINVDNKAEGRDLVEEALMPLIKYDKQHDTELYQTLTKIVEKDWNLLRTSEALHFHYNTVKYRLRRIEEILNLDFSKYEDKLKVAVAICWKNIAG